MTDPELVSKVELSFACNQLKNMDVLSKSDPQIIIFMRNTLTEQWREIARTEIIYDNLNPRFTRSLIVEYHFETHQYIKLVVIDIDDAKTTNIASQDLIGECDTTLAEIITSRGSVFTKPIIHPQKQTEKRGTVSVRSEEVSNIDALTHFKIRAVNLDKKDFFGKSDPFLTISRSTENGEWQVVHRTEEHKNTLNVTWNPFTLSAQKLCNGDLHRTLRFECYDWNRSGKHEIIGSADTSLDDLIQKPGTQLPLINAKKKQKKSKYISSGTLIFDSVDYEKKHSMLDYIRGGHQINISVAIDFTASNGDPRTPQSLHYRSQYMNQYQTAITSIGSILDHYSSTHLYPVYGFGAKIPVNGNWEVSHCFPANLQMDPNVYGVNGILQAYDNAVSRCVLHGPTNFSPILRAANTNTAYQNGLNTYSILLILTDGIISDMQATIAEIVSASDLPLSIIIVGVGNDNFENMDILDADDTPLVHNGKVMSRDIVQFVPFRNFIGKDPGELARAVLHEVPEQFTGYYRMRKIAPNPPPLYRFDSIRPQ